MIDTFGADRQATWGTVIQNIDTMLQGVIDRMALVGALSNGVDRQADLVKSQMDTITKGVGRLIDADMNQESARMKALQTQQQLGLQSLSIANGSADNVLRLYQ
jgi:flagellin